MHGVFGSHGAVRWFVLRKQKGVSIAMSKQLSFVVDDETLELLEQLKRDLKASTTASVFRKAIALTQLAVEQAKDGSGKMKDPMATITMRAKADEPGVHETSVALRA
jgi:urocanate hydratase